MDKVRMGTGLEEEQAKMLKYADMMRKGCKVMLATGTCSLAVFGLFSALGFYPYVFLKTGVGLLGAATVFNVRSKDHARIAEEIGERMKLLSRLEPF